ncbi:uncharacterized protein GGS22DRAFT_79952 [Annulohypoxylon maeteangense]|uniref:uncharacterized protein n=1 Tax=Annulohypoxylon maeteangense TaxID=1927788 RepID=UPI00200830D1|nr:uncharacterized protein GGS22DRAFT_79952 [Annulohypoxylon maeteangense]KAI0880768.1 hypothetical protein GGS22DRAFT_79952 [Annulohypoxylon maeteangense]
MSSVALPSNFRPHLPSPTHTTFTNSYPLRQNSSLDKLQDHLVHGTHLYKGGLRTPPTENTMSATFHNPVLSNTYNSHVALARQPNALMQTGRTGGVYPGTMANSYSTTHTLQQPQYQQPPQLVQPAVSQAVTSQPVYPGSQSSQHSTRSTTPGSTGSLSVRSEGTVSRRDSAMVTHCMQLPSCISPNGGNLDDFAALMTCFFWFETMDTITAAEQIKQRSPADPIPPLSQYTEPCPAYKQWVNKILSTTQVTQNVILLALLFVYRLKKVNPKVNGSPGSEYRLLTVALMLGNKFLDDNTYTNNTWAEVSSISVKEIHIMEVEFLSNMRYGLLTSKEEWEEWLQKLACFHEYYERAKIDEQRRNIPPPMPMTVPSPNHGRYTSPLPSPTCILPSTGPGAQLSLAAAYSPNPAIQNQAWNGYHHAPSVSPLASKPSLGHPMVRKRSLESPDTFEHAPKRVTRQPPAAMMPSTRPIHGGAEGVRLPVPHLTLDTSQAVTPLTYPPSSHYPQPAVSLPPIGSGMRAMSTVYPTATTSWAPQGSMVATCGPQTPSYVLPPSYGTPTKRHSPTGLAHFGSSPLAEAYGTHTPISNSPLVYLQQRASPYKPVRRVNHLLNPPPSIPLSQYHLGSNQMHYQPLGRRNDLRSGIVPEFLPAYPPNHRSPTGHTY